MCLKKKIYTDIHYYFKIGIIDWVGYGKNVVLFDVATEETNVVYIQTLKILKLAIKFFQRHIFWSKRNGHYFIPRLFNKRNITHSH